jgi:S1-C subfamily serine protease
MKNDLSNLVAVLGIGLLQGCTSTAVVKNANETPIRDYTTDLYLIAPQQDPRSVVPMVVREFEAMGFKVSLMTPDKPVAGSQGTGFLISANGHILTCAHILGEEPAATIRIAGARYEADVVHKDKEVDLALLKIRQVNVADLKPLSFRKDKKPGIGEDVSTVGFPLSNVLGNSARYTKGSISSTTGLKDDPKQLQFSAQIQPGSSGGPLFDKNGVVLGVVSQTLNPLRTLANTGGALPQNINFAIKGDVVLDYLAAADNNLYGSLSFDKGSSVEEIQRSVVKIRSGIITEEWEKRPKLVARLDYSSMWDIWYKFRVFVLRFYDFDSHDFLFAAGQRRLNPLSTEEKVIKDTFVEIKGILRPGGS